MIAAAVLQSTLVGAALLMFAELSPRSDARFRHALLCIALLKFALPPFILIPASNRLRGPAAEPSAWMKGMAFVYLTGAAIALVSVAVRWMKLRTVVRRSANHRSPAYETIALELGLTRVPKLLVTSAAFGPAAVGVLKPAVIVPETLVRELDEEWLAVVYAHELAHHARRDVLIGYLQALLAVIWWFHPLFHILSRRVNELREDCVDDQILGRRFSSDDQYCALLLDAAGYATTSLAIGSSGMAAGLHPLHRRIRRIMTGETFNALPFSRRTIAAIVLAAVLSLPGFVPDRDHSRSPSPSPSPSPSESPSDSPSP